ncbi:MAG: hypothetical protein DRJ03_12055 [Chloroflexi bacterium]|nr:MAG: hypothetical protein DRJ03_12055 [Chloroflexota bacterium]
MPAQIKSDVEINATKRLEKIVIKIDQLEALQQKRRMLHETIHSEKIKRVFLSAEMRAVTWKYARYVRTRDALLFRAVKNEHQRTFLRMVNSELSGMVGLAICYESIDLLFDTADRAPSARGAHVMVPLYNAATHLTSLRKRGYHFIASVSFKEQLRREEAQLRQTTALYNQMREYEQEDLAAAKKKKARRQRK